MNVIFLDPSPCDVKPCGKNGVCKEEEEDYTCTCTPQYKGKHCDEIG